MITTSWHGGDVTRTGAIGCAIACGPGRADLVDRTAHADRVDLGDGRERADRDRHVVATAGRVDHVGEQEGAALVLRQPALELPARERMQLGVLVDRPVDAREQAARLEPREVLLEIARRAGGFRADVAVLFALSSIVQNLVPAPPLVPSRDAALRAAPHHEARRVNTPGAFSIWSNQSKPISLTMRLEITISRASVLGSALKCWWTVNGGT